MKALLLGLILCGLLMMSFINFFDKPTADDRLPQFGEELAKKYQLMMVGRACSSMFNIHQKIWGLNFADYKPKTIEEARYQIVSMADLFWQEINKNPLYNEELLYFAKVHPKHNPYTGILPSMVALKISYWDENVEKRMKPYLAQVRLINETIQYFYANPNTQALDDPIIEPLAEAREKIKNP